MKILIIGANFDNKGGHLMLLAAIEFVRSRFGDDAPVIPHSVGAFERLHELQCRLLNFPLLHVTEPLFGQSLYNGVIVSKNRELDGNRVNWQDINGILDISGFAYSDQWGNVPLHNLRLLCNACYEYKKKLVFLPQAFGPFDIPDNRANAEISLPVADKIYARDRTSLSNLNRLNHSQGVGKIALAPDITLGYSCEVAPREDYCCFIPNIRILDKGNENWKDSYIQYLDAAARLILENTSLSIRFLMHDKHDFDSKTGIVSLLKPLLDEARIRIESEENPRRIKKIIACSQFIVGSRFHALAGALSTQTPALALGWSHKYREIFSDYGMEPYCFLEPSNDILPRVKQLISPEVRANIQQQLSDRGKIIQEKNSKMWDEVEAVFTS